MDFQAKLKDMLKAKVVEEFKDTAKEFATSPEKDELLERYNDFGSQFRLGMHKEENGDVIIENEYIDKASDSWDKLENYAIRLNQSEWGDKGREFYKKLSKTKEFDSVKWAYVNYMTWSAKKAPYEKSIAQLKTAINEEVKITDMPTTEKGKHFLGEAKTQYDGLYADAMEDLKVEKAMKKELEEERKKDEEAAKKKAEEEKKAAESLIEMHGLYEDVMNYY